MRALVVLWAVTSIVGSQTSALAASTVGAVRVLPTCVINPGDRVMLEVYVFSSTLPTYLFEPTQIEIVDNEIVIDLFVTSGISHALSEAMVPIDLGSYPPGAYTFTIRKHDPRRPEIQEFSGSFVVERQRCQNALRDRGHLYWADYRGMIKRSALDGSKMAGIIDAGSISGFSLDQARNEIFWASIDTPIFEATSKATVERANLDGSNRRMLLSMDWEVWPRGLIRSGRFLFWTGGQYSNTIWRHKLDGSESGVIISGLNSVVSLLVDENEDKIYWSDWKQIYRANIDGSQVESIQSDLCSARLLALDSDDRIYWSVCASESLDSGLYSSNLDGTEVVSVAGGPTVCPVSVLLDVVPGKVYWSNCYTQTGIYRANTDGTEFEIVVPDLTHVAGDLTYDKRSEKFFWLNPSIVVELGAGVLMSANLDGTEVSAIAEGVGDAYGLSLDRATRAVHVRPNVPP